MLPKFSIWFLEIYTYPLLMGIAWGAAAWRFLLLNEKLPFGLKKPKTFLVGSFLSSWIGAKLFYLWTAEISGAEETLLNSNFWMGGGFVFYGGLIFGFLFALVFAYWNKQKLVQFNVLLAPLALGHGIGRIGCFLAGCCYGVKTSSPVGIFMHGAHRYPTQLLEAFALFFLAYVFSRDKMLRSKEALWKYLFAYGLFRFAVEFFRGDSVRGFHLWGASTSQLIAAGFLAVSLTTLLGQRLIKPRNLF